MKINNSNIDFIKHIRDSKGEPISVGDRLVMRDFYKTGDEVIVRVFWQEKGSFWAVKDEKDGAYTGLTEDGAKKATVLA